MNKQSQNLNDNSEANLHAIDYWQIIKNRYGIILLTAFLVFATAAIITYVLPKKYTSNTTIAIHSPDTSGNPLNSQFGQELSGALVGRNFIATQTKLMTSEVTLVQVVEALDLQTRWDVDENGAVSMLKGKIKVSPVIGTDLITISVEHSEQEECQEIAETVALAYRKQREVEESDRIDAKLSALDSELQAQEDKVQEKKIILNTMVQNTGHTYIEGGRSNTSLGDLEQSVYSSGRLRLEELKKNKRSLENQIKTLSGKSDDDLISTAAGLNIVESRVPRLYEQLITSDRELVGFQVSGYGPKHPRMISAQKINAELRKDITVAVEELRETMHAQLQLVNADLEVQDTVVNENREAALGKAMTSHDFAEARRNYEQEKSLLEAMQLQHTTKRIQIKMPKNIISIYEKAKKPKRQSFPNVNLNLIIGGILGLVIGIGLAFFLEIIDTSIKSLDDVERFLQTPVLAVIPKDIAVLHKEAGNSPDIEAYRILRTNIEFNRKSADNNCITVVSGGAGEGKSTTLVNLAYVCAQGGYSTLIIDADLRRPSVHTFFDINNSVGLTNYLTTNLTLEDVVLQTPVDNLYFMPSGQTPADPSGILNSNRMSELIADVKQRFDLVLIDSPPILGVSDASVISSEADQTMLVIQHRKLPRNMLIKVKQAVENVGGDILGVVLNNVDIRSDNQYQYYTSYYTYYSTTDTTPNDSDRNPIKNNDELKVVKDNEQDSLY